MSVVKTGGKLIRLQNVENINIVGVLFCSVGF